MDSKVCEYLRKKISEEERETIVYNGLEASLPRDVTRLGHVDSLLDAQKKEIGELKILYDEACVHPVHRNDNPFAHAGALAGNVYPKSEKPLVSMARSFGQEYGRTPKEEHCIEKCFEYSRLGDKEGFNACVGRCMSVDAGVYISPDSVSAKLASAGFRGTDYDPFDLKSPLPASIHWRDDTGVHDVGNVREVYIGEETFTIYPQNHDDISVWYSMLKSFSARAEPR